MSLTANQPCVATGATTIKTVDAATFMATYMGISGTPVPSTRRVNAGGIATGGGDLTADVTITVSAGTTSGTACAGNDARLSDARTPTAHATSHQPGGTDAMAVDALAATGSLRTLGTSGTSACAGNDARLSDTRTPTDNTVSTAKLVDASVTLAKMENRAQATFIGRKSGAGTGAPQEMSASEANTILGATVNPRYKRWFGV